jgi:hypothetical protein
MQRPTQTQLPRPHQSRQSLCAATPRGSRRVPRENIFFLGMHRKLYQRTARRGGAHQCEHRRRADMSRQQGLYGPLS